MKKMYIDVEQYSKSIFTIEYDPNKTIKDLKERIGKPENLKLYFQNIELSDDKKFYDYNIKATDGYNYQERSLLYLIDLQYLKVNIYINKKNIILTYYLKGSNSILNLKETIFENENIPVEKIQILKEDKILDDNKLIEDFIPDFNFNLNFLETDKIKINIIDGNNKETIYVDPFSTPDIIEEQLKKDFAFRLSYKGTLLNLFKLLIQYNIKVGDDLELIKSKGSINLKIDAPSQTFVVKMYLEQKTSELWKYLQPIIGNKSRHIMLFRFGFMMLPGDKTFDELNIGNNEKIKARLSPIGG